MLHEQLYVFLTVNWVVREQKDVKPVKVTLKWYKPAPWNQAR